MIYIMPSRYEGLVKALKGYEKTGIPFLGFNRNGFGHPQFGDDEGIYYVIPRLAQALHIDLGQASQLFFLGLILLSLAAGLIGCFLLLRTGIGRAAAAAGLCLVSAAAYYLGDVYIMSSSVVVGIVPLFLFFAGRRKTDFPFVLFLFLSGLVIGSAHFIRVHAGTAVLLFMLAYIAFSKEQRRHTAVLAAPVALGVLVPVLYFSMLLNERDAFLMKHQSRMEPAVRRHVFWHSAYIGLGFLTNKYGIEYRDEIAIEKVRLMAPDAAFLSKNYELTLRNECLNILKQEPVFVVTTLFAKAGVLLFYFLLFAHVGLLAAFVNRKDMPFEAAFWIAMGFSCLPGLLIIPYPNYLLGLIAFAALYGIIHINTFIAAGGWKKRHPFPENPRD